MRSDQKRRLSVSVIIPTYNRADLVVEAVESALNQTRQPDEIVVVDDGSTDNTQQVLKRYGPPVVVLWQPNQRQSAARNYGMKVAKGEVFVFLDSDDLLLPKCIERTVEALEVHPDVGVVYPDWCAINCQGQQLGVWSEMKPGKRFSGMALGALGYDWHCLSMSSATVRRAALRDVVFDEGMSHSAEDFEFWRRLAAQCQFLYIDEVLAAVRDHEVQITKTNSTQLLDGIIEVQQRIMRMPEFTHVPRNEKARLFCHHGIQQALRGRCGVARRFFARAIVTAPAYSWAYIMLGLSLLGERPLQILHALRRRQQQLAKRRRASDRAFIPAMPRPSTLPSNSTELCASAIAALQMEARS
jgi:glycosyltransferase involved in cell wall biosynthesis